jgi:hypothetical protein
MNAYDSVSVAGLSFHDSHIQGISWKNNGDDLVLDLEWLPQVGLGLPVGPVRASLRFTFVTDLILDIKFSNSMGYVSIYSSVFSCLPGGRWSVVLDFIGIPDGTIRFECNDMALGLEP